MRALTLSETIAADAAYTGRLLDAFYRALYLQEVISTRAASIIQRLAAARSDNRPCGILLIALRMEDCAEIVLRCAVEKGFYKPVTGTDSAKDIA